MQCYGPGSGIRCLFDPGIRDGQILKFLKFFDTDLGWKKSDPVSGMEKFGSRILDKHPGSATLGTEPVRYLYSVLLESGIGYHYYYNSVKNSQLKTKTKQVFFSCCQRLYLSVYGTLPQSNRFNCVLCP